MHFFISKTEGLCRPAAYRIQQYPMYPPTLRENAIDMSNLSLDPDQGEATVSEDGLLTLYGILITSGYSSAPKRDLYWSLDTDVHNESIADAMQRNRFDEMIASGMWLRTQRSLTTHSLR